MDNRQDLGASQATGLSQVEPQSSQGLAPTGFDPSRADHAAIEASALIVEDYAGEQSYSSWEASRTGNREAAHFYHRRFEMLCAAVARIRGQISPQHVLAMALTRPGMKRWTQAMVDQQLASIRDSDGSPKGGDACGSVHDSAGPKDIAPTTPSQGNSSCPVK